MLPAALIAPLAAGLGDRFRRERFLLVDRARGSAALAASGAAFFYGRSQVLIYLLAGVVGITSTLFRPALQAILPSLARTPEELIASNGATSTIESLGMLAGPLLAGVLVALADPGVVFFVAAGALLVAAGLLAAVHCEGRIQLTAVGDAREVVLAGFRGAADLVDGQVFAPVSPSGRTRPNRRLRPRRCAAGPGRAASGRPVRRNRDAGRAMRLRHCRSTRSTPGVRPGSSVAHLRIASFTPVPAMPSVMSSANMSTIVSGPPMSVFGPRKWKKCG